MTAIATISPTELAELHKQRRQLDLIDVRTPAEFRALHVAFARSVPLDQLNPDAVMKTRGEADIEPLYIICQSGKRGEQACQLFRQAGYEKVFNVEGGVKACEAAGVEVTRGKQTISLERQVRIAAGTLVLTGVVLGLLVHPAFVGLSAFVGAGLIFAGLTDTCGMAMLLARMPWNR